MTATARVLRDSAAPSWSECSLDEFLSVVQAGLRARSLAPYLGPGVAELTTGATMPLSYQQLADHLSTKVALPRRAKGNPWAAAQYIESFKHRATLVALLREAFQGERQPLSFHHYLAQLELPLIVDTWYDGTMRRALGASSASWCEIQGTDRTGVASPLWFEAYDASGKTLDPKAVSEQRTVLYAPHGAAAPAGRFLLSDADYVEVLTEIDIQTPIPEVVKVRRADLGFVFLGCRFHDQLLRTFARQILKRSQGPHFALFENRELSKMEQRFASELGLRIVFAPLASVLKELSR